MIVIANARTQRLALVDQIVNAVLYEGYVLYPYRASSVKNRQRWTFGGVYPRAYSELQGASEPWSLQTECLVLAGERPMTMVEVRVRFLQLIARQVGQLPRPLAELPAAAELDFQVVESLEIGERVYRTWQEAVEREVDGGAIALAELLAGPRRLGFRFPTERVREQLRDATGEVVGLVERRQEALEGVVELLAEPVGSNSSSSPCGC